MMKCFTHPQELVKATKIIYCAGFFLTVSPKTMVSLGEHVASAGKTFCLNLSAPFIIQFFKEPLGQVMPFVDFLFANESEAETYGEENNLGTDLSEIALAIARQPKVRGDRAVRTSLAALLCVHL